MKKAFSFLTIILILFFAFPNSSSHQITPSSLNLTPKGIRLTVINDPSDSIVISWYTEEQASDPRVTYSKNPELINSESIEASVKIIDSTYIYQAELTGLKPETTYYFEVSSDASNKKAEIMSFTTAPGRKINNVKFLIWGDSRSQYDVREEISKKAMEKFDDIDFTLHTGDIVTDGSRQGLWDRYFLDTEVINGYKQGFFIEGNHEKGLITKMYDNIALPTNGIDSRYYSFNWGPVSIVALNTNDAEIWAHEKMPLIWLDTELSNFNQDKYCLWKIAGMHHPIFNSQIGRDDEHELIPTWCPIFEKYGVDLVFAGHNHYYERSYPMNHQGELDNSEFRNFNNPSDPIYFIAAGAGAPLYDRTKGQEDYESPSYSAYYKSIYHFVLVDIVVDSLEQTTTLTIEAWGMTEKDDVFSDLNLFDKITITKDLPVKYINSDYETPELVSHVRIPYILYFFLYFGAIGLFIVVFNRPMLMRYWNYKRPLLKEKYSRNKNKEKQAPRCKTGFSIVLFLVISIIMSVLFVYLDFVDEEIAIALGIAVSICMMISLNRVLIGKSSALKTISNLFLYLSAVGTIAFFLLYQNLIFYLFYLNFIIIAGAIALTWGANHLSKNIKPSKMSNKDSFYLGGTMMTFGVIFLLISVMNLIALF